MFGGLLGIFAIGHRDCDAAVFATFRRVGIRDPVEGNGFRRFYNYAVFDGDLQICFGFHGFTLPPPQRISCFRTSGNVRRTKRCSEWRRATRLQIRESVTAAIADLCVR